jgi:hypothetical protein
MQPLDTSVEIGGTAHFSVSAIGAPPLLYQWRFNGARIIGATNSEVALPNITPQDFGTYTVDVTNPLGTVTSAPARLFHAASLEVFPAVELVFRTDPSASYALERSTDLATWHLAESPVVSPTGQTSRLYPARTQKSYYRLRMLTPNMPLIVAPQTEIELQAPHKEYLIQLAGDTNRYVLRFPVPGAYHLAFSGITQTGTVTRAAREENIWTFTLTPGPGQPGAGAGVVRMAFTEPRQGTWVFTPDGKVPSVGLFFLTPTTEPEVIARTLRLFYQGAGTERFDFTSATTVSYENGADRGTYTYDRTNRRISITLASGAQYEIILVNASQATVYYRSPLGEAVTDPATYTLQ